jgi:ubiquinone biosynthesis protein UbiJ
MSPLAPETVLATALNALLARQPAARARLARHAGKTLRLSLPLLTLQLTIEQDGEVVAFALAARDALPALTLTPTPASVPSWLAGGATADLFHVAGDGLFAADIAHALADFDWVLSLQPLLGDVVASRVDGWLRASDQWRRHAATSIGRNIAEYAVHERALLVDPPAIHAFIAEVDRLREDVDRLEARLDGLGTSRGVS